MEIFIPQILIPRNLEPKDEFTAGIGVYGEYQITKRRRGIVVQDFTMKNLITDKGLEWLASMSDQYLLARCQYLQLGTGTAEPVTTDTTLQAMGFSGKNYTTYKAGQGASPDYWMELQWDLGLTEAIGTWTEIGVGKDSGSPYQVFSRALFKDDLGNPIQVQKTGDDTLTVIYKLHIKRVSDTPFSSVVNVEGVGNVTVESIILKAGLEGLSGHVRFISSSQNYVPAKAWLGSNNEALTPTPADSANPLRSRFDISADVPYTVSLYQLSAHASPNKYRDLTFEWPTGVVGNIGEACFMVAGYLWNPMFMSRFTPVIPKDNTKKFRLNYRITFNRI